MPIFYQWFRSTTVYQSLKNAVRPFCKKGCLFKNQIVSKWTKPDELVTKWEQLENECDLDCSADGTYGRKTI